MRLYVREKVGPSQKRAGGGVTPAPLENQARAANLRLKNSQFLVHCAMVTMRHAWYNAPNGGMMFWKPKAKVVKPRQLTGIEKMELEERRSAQEKEDAQKRENEAKWRAESKAKIEQAYARIAELEKKFGAELQELETLRTLVRPVQIFGLGMYGLQNQLSNPYQVQPCVPMTGLGSLLGGIL